MAQCFPVAAEQGQMCDHCITHLPLFVCRRHRRRGYKRYITRRSDMELRAKLGLLTKAPLAMEACFPETIQMDSAQFSAFMQELAAGR